MIFFTILIVLLRIYSVLLWGRFIFEWIRVLSPAFKPRGVLLVLVEAVYTATDPPIKFVRKLVPPIRVGQLSLDLALMLVLLGVWALIQVLAIVAVSLS